MRSRPSPSTGRPRSRRRRLHVDAYLFPAIVGGGLGDIEEVLAAGRRLLRAGVRVRLYHGAGRPWPRGVDGPWAWPEAEHVRALNDRAGAAMTVAPAWGITAAPAGPPPLGRAGPWAAEAAEVEAAYGPDRTVHASLEEFARTLTVTEENRERFREGGVRSREIPRRLRRAATEGEVDRFDRSFRRFRAFDRPNVLHLFATFRPSRTFGREFPEAVQTGPLWPARFRPTAARRRRPREWVWYASPPSAERIAPGVLQGLSGIRPPVRLFVRSPRAWELSDLSDLSGPLEVASTPIPSPAWRRRFARAELRIVTGSRTLLEAIEVGGPFLYFNGLLGEGSRRRRHRPEKVVALVAALRAAGAPNDRLRDLVDFSRGRRVRAVAHRAALREGGWCLGLPPVRPTGFRTPFDDAGSLLVAVARALDRPGSSAREVVARVRAGSNP